MKLTKFDKVVCRKIHDEITEALRPVAEKYGLRIVPWGGTFDALEWVVKTKLLVTDEATVETESKALWDRYCQLFDMKPEDFGRRWKQGEYEMRIAGLDLKKQKNAIVLMRSDGKRFIAPPASVKARLVMAGGGRP